MTRSADIARNKIRLFIAGAQKSGTTSLKQYLGEHPEITTHLQKEFAYFYDETEFERGEKVAYSKYFGAPTDPRVLIAKNAGLYVKETAIRRLRDHNPDCHIVLILRNPADRAYSAYLMEKNYGNYSGSFEDVEQLTANRDSRDWRFEFFIRMGMYAEYLRVMYRYFPKEQVTCLLYEDFETRPSEICTQLFKTIGVDATFVPDTQVRYNVTHKMRSSGYARFVIQLLQNDNPIKKVARRIIPRGQDFKLGEMLRNVNKSSEKPVKMETQVRTRLCAFYRPYNDELSRLTGLNVSSWNAPDSK